MAEDRLAEMRHRELAALARCDALARRAHRARLGAQPEEVAAGDAARRWRASLGRRLVSAGLRLGLPPRQRHAAGDHADRLLAGEEGAGGASSPTS